MKKTENTKYYYFFDEAGDPQILGRHGVNLIENGSASKTFMVGYLAVREPQLCRKALMELHNRLMQDEFLADIPSMQKSTAVSFHACKDCPEVRAEVYRLLKTLDVEFYCIVARKEADRFRRMFDLKEKELYKHLVKKLLENRLHLYSEIDLYFSSMGNVVRKETMEEAIQGAILRFREKWGHDNNSILRVIIQKNSEEPLLQAADYMLWAIQRAYERGEYRYYNFLKDKIKLVYDIFDTRYYGSKDHSLFYTPTNPLEAKKIDPV